VSAGAWVLVVAAAVAIGFGLYRAFTDGRFRGTHRVRRVDGPAPEPGASSVLEGTAWADHLGERVTLLQFSSAFCAPCRATRRILADVAAAEPGVAHLEIDAEHHLDLVRRLGVLRTPTTLVLDPRGVELSRAQGAPTKDAVLRTISAIGG
jgi:thiol-disulfide isomerase/thioredoxin